VESLKKLFSAFMKLCGWKLVSEPMRCPHHLITCSRLVNGEKNDELRNKGANGHRRPNHPIDLRDDRKNGRNYERDDEHRGAAND
jgi:hypothetical protein